MVRAQGVTWDRRTVLRALAVLAALSVVVVAVVGGRLHDGAPGDADTGALSGNDEPQAAPAQEVVPGQRIEGGPDPATTLPTVFRISSFNILGFGHTKPGGNRPGWADGRTRMRWQIELLAGHDVDLVGFQEFQPEQFQTFREETGDAWGVYPGSELARAAMHNSIAWRKDTWKLVEKQTLAIPYFKGVPIRMPVLLLRNLETGQHAWFGNFHNPANARGNAERWRDKATAMQIAMANQKIADTGFPVFITGDMNEKDEYFCKMTTRAPMISASGGSRGTPPCRVPRPTYVDWVFGSNHTLFSGYVADRSELVRKSTDHPMIVATAMIPPAVQPWSCPTSPVPC